MGPGEQKQVEAVLLFNYMSPEYKNDSEDDSVYKITNLKWNSDALKSRKRIGHKKLHYKTRISEKSRRKNPIEIIRTVYRLPF